MRPDLRAALERALGATVLDTMSLQGGDVAESYRVELADGRTVFAKSHRDAPPDFFGTEAAGLAWLAEPGVIPVPRVLAHADSQPNHLVLEWVDEGPRHHRATPEGEAAFGRSLAELHLSAAPGFGREDRRTTGSRGLPNEPCTTWAEFYASQRLVPLARLAARARALDPGTVADLERVAERLTSVGGPPEPPARLHGDLWAGNRLVDRARRSWLIDPAADGGHREFDLAMMRLFGGFGEASFAAYQERSPLAPGWEERVPLHQIAPLVVHAIKFGGSYRAAAGSHRPLSLKARR